MLSDDPGGWDANGRECQDGRDICIHTDDSLYVQNCKATTCAQSLQSCPTLCDPMDYSTLGFSVHEIFQARILEQVAILFFRGSS